MTEDAPIGPPLGWPVEGRPLVRAAVFCSGVRHHPFGAFDIVGVFEATTMDAERGASGAFERDLGLFIRIVGIDLTRPHRLVLRWTDELNRPLGQQRIFDYYPLEGEDPGGIDLEDHVRFELAEGRSGRFRLLIELNEELIGWIPYRLIVTTTTAEGES